jgi:hypothetical protein
VKKDYTIRTVRAINNAMDRGEKSTKIAKRLNMSQQQVAAIMGNLKRGVYNL